MKLMTAAIAEALYQNDQQTIRSGASHDAIVVKYFNPTGPQTWYVVSGTPLDADGEPVDDIDGAKDWHLYGFADTGDPWGAELGYTLLSDLEGMKEYTPLGCERDLNYTGSLEQVQQETRARRA